MERTTKDLEKELQAAEKKLEKIRNQQAAKNANYNANSVDRLGFTVPKGKKEVIQAAAAKKGLSVNAYLAGLALADAEKTMEE